MNTLKEDIRVRMMRIESSLSVLKVVVAWYKVLRLLKRSAIYATIRAMA